MRLSPPPQVRDACLSPAPHHPPPAYGERLARSPASLLITSSGIQQPSRPSHHTAQSNKPPILATVYIYSRRACSSAIRTETRLGSRHKRPSYHMHLSPAPQVTHADAPASENVPAQHRHASVHRHEHVAVLHQLPSAATRHAPMLHLSSAPHFPPHTLRGQEAGTHTHTHTPKNVPVRYE
jgi:hypothetical protein